MKMSNFLPIAFIAFILISLVVAKQPVSNDEKIVTSFGECAIANGITSIFFNSLGFSLHTLCCTFLSIVTYEEGKNFLVETIKGTIWNIGVEVVLNYLGIELGMVLNIAMKELGNIWKILQMIGII